MDVVLRRLRADDISQVIDIEREAFSPLWSSTPFKRDLNNRYASYLVACCAPDPEEAVPEESAPISENVHFWRCLLPGLRRVVSKIERQAVPNSSIAGYVSVWYQGEEAHITEIAVREKLRGRGFGELLLIGSFEGRCGIRLQGDDSWRCGSLTLLPKDCTKNTASSRVGTP